MTMRLVAYEPTYLMTVYNIRTDPANADGFFDKRPIDLHTHMSFMATHGKDYRICLYDDTPVGFIGCVNDDIRIGVDPACKNLGVGTFMLTSTRILWPTAKAKILRHNYPSLMLFQKCGWKIVSQDDTWVYLEQVMV